MKKVLCIVSLLLILTSCKFSKEKSKIVIAKNLLGNWENKTHDGKLVEIWQKLNDSVYNGQALFIKENDTLHSEKMQLKQNGERLTYTSTIKGQNNDHEVTFLQNIKNEKQLVFENPNNEYPKKISYNPTSKNSLMIEISGMKQGKPSLDTYLLKKIK